jgi:hypothetical protein
LVNAAQNASENNKHAAQRLKAEKTLGRILPRSMTLANARKEYLAQLDVRKSTRARLGAEKAGFCTGQRT